MLFSFGKAKVFGNLRGQGGALGFFLEKFGVDGGSVRVGIVGIVGTGFACWLLPTLGGFDVDERERDLLFGAAALGADVMDDVADDLVAHDDLVAAVFEDEAGAMRGGRVGLERRGVLRTKRRDEGEGCQEDGGENLRSVG